RTRPPARCCCSARCPSRADGGPSGPDRRHAGGVGACDAGGASGSASSRNAIFIRMALARKIAVQGYPLRGKGGMAMVTMTALCRSLLAVLVMATLAVAADVPRSSRTPADQDLSDARARIDAKDWPGAAEILKKSAARDPGNAQYRNPFASSSPPPPS